MPVGLRVVRGQRCASGREGRPRHNLVMTDRSLQYVAAPSDVVRRFELARQDPQLVIVDGFHAVKHAVRFNADLQVIVTDAPNLVEELSLELAPDILGVLRRRMHVLGPADFAVLTARRPPTALLAVARRPLESFSNALMPGLGPVVFLESPRHAGNAGAVIRVAAAAGAHSVIASGDLDLWSEPVMRGAAGLHFAIEIAHAPAGPIPTTRRLFGLDPDGDELDPAELCDDTVLVFGTERGGLSDEVKQQADALFRLPMRAGVSSLNLATAVSATLYLVAHASASRQWRVEPSDTRFAATGAVSAARKEH